MILRKATDRLAAIHPGEYPARGLHEACLRLTINALAVALRVPATRISEIVNERRAISVDTAFRLSLYFSERRPSTGLRTCNQPMILL